ncbi:uncharacterized protein LOC132551280 [Ylistrum balloti]|uniref:uncharacterized protein LOC132551280 n=1 Tax=Ylistrum balloti TaxID=509963 RepID=UPI002905CA98|nr:uncharacterized protein LOC132551280 [Ylistrum balloti]
MECRCTCRCKANKGMMVTPQMHRQKSDMQEELLVKLGAKEEKFDWHPDILYRRMERPQSSVVADYSIDIKIGRPKLYCIGTRNPWDCGNQALRQMTMKAKQGPRSLFFGKKPKPINILNIHRPAPPRISTASTRVILQPLSLARSKTAKPKVSVKESLLKNPQQLYNNLNSSTTISKLYNNLNSSTTISTALQQSQQLYNNLKALQQSQQLYNNLKALQQSQQLYNNLNSSTTIPIALQQSQ